MPQGVVIKGNANPQAAQEVDPTNSAARISLRPVEVGAYGSYSVSVVSGIMAAGLSAGSPIIAFRFPGGTPPLALLRRVAVSLGTDGTAFAQGSVIIDLIVARAFTVQDTGGGVITMNTKGDEKRRGSMPVPTALIQASSTATLTAGTRTLDDNPIASVVGSLGAVPATMIPKTWLWDPTECGRWPLILTANEGFVIRATVPATGTWKFGIDIDWEEVAAF